jgi:hypothetical protein
LQILRVFDNRRPPPAVMTDLALVVWFIGPEHIAITKSDGVTQTLTSLNQVRVARRVLLSTSHPS